MSLYKLSEDWRGIKECGAGDSYSCLQAAAVSYTKNSLVLHGTASTIPFNS